MLIMFFCIFFVYDVISLFSYLKCISLKGGRNYLSRIPRKYLNQNYRERYHLIYTIVAFVNFHLHIDFF